MMSRRFRSGVWAVFAVVLCAGLFLSAGETEAADRQATIQRSRALLSEAQEAFAAGEEDTALARLESVLEDDPANPDAFYFIGLIKLSHADTSGAEVALVEGVRLAPMSRRLKLLLARVWVEAGKTDEAELLVGEVMALRPRDLDALYVQGLIFLARGDSTAAIGAWESALLEEMGGEDQ